MNTKLYRKFFLFLIIMFFYKTLFCQTNALHYNIIAEYNSIFLNDTNNLKSEKSEQTLLLSDGVTSVFLSKNHFDYDSASNIQKMKGGKWGITDNAFLINHKFSLKFYIYKTEKKIDTYDSYFFLNSETLMHYSENQPIIRWVISNDTLLINNITCQKAECDYGNRHWIAWFAPSIPLNDGPYKFGGLPGLILRINDVKNQWQFQLSFLKQLDNPKEYNSFFYFPPKDIKSRAQYLDLKKEHFNNAFEIDKISNPWQTRGVSNEVLKQKKKQYNYWSTQNNNWIELK